MEKKYLFLLIFVNLFYSCGQFTDDKSFSVKNKIIGTKLVFKTNLTYSIKNDPIGSSSIIVEIQDDKGNLDINANQVVTLALQYDPTNGQALLSGTLSKTPTAGIVIFNDIKLNVVNDNYSFVASATGLTSAISNNFEIKEWAKQYGANSIPGETFLGQTNIGDERCMHGTIDSKGYVYCAGETNNNFISTNAGSGTKDIFIIKFDPITSEEVASFQLGKNAESSPHIISLSEDEVLGGIEVDSFGNIYLIGITSSNLAEPLAMYSGSAYDPLSYPLYNTDIFVVKLDKNLNILWAKQFGENSKLSTDPSCICDNSMGESVAATAIDSSGNLYIAGGSTSDLFRNNPYSDRLINSGTTPQPYADMFAFKMNSDGLPLWIYHVGETSPKTQEAISGIKLHGNELYFVSKTTGDWIEGSGEQLGTGTYDLVLGKLNSEDGSQIVLNQIGSSEMNALSFISDTQYSEFSIGKFGIDADGNFYVAGVAQGPFAQADANTDSLYDAFILKADSNAQPIAAFQYGGTNVPEPTDASATMILVRGLVIDSNNNSYTLLTSKSDQLGMSPGNYYDSYIFKLDSNLNPIGNNLGVIQFGVDNILTGADKTYDDSFINLLIDSTERFYIMGGTSSSYAEQRSTSIDPIIFKTDL